MRILYLCHRIPYPPDKGDKIRAFHELEALAARHEVDLFSLVDTRTDLVHKEALAQYCRQVTIAEVSPRWSRLLSLPYVVTNKPLTLPYFYSAALAKQVRDAVARNSYDCIFVYCSAMAQYVEEAGTIPIITDLVDVDSDKWTQYATFTRFPISAVYKREGKRLEEYERAVCSRSAHVVVSTDREAALARRIAPEARVHVVTNGVDTDFFKPDAFQSDKTGAGIIFTGDMSYFPNEQAVVYFARQVLPLIRRSVPDARFYIVGRSPGPNVKKLQSIAGVEVTGFVPDVRTYLAKAQVSVAPFLIAAGIQNKILEAMAAGVPVVATSSTTRGLASQVAAIVDVADQASQLAERVTGLLCDPNRAREKGMQSRRAVAAAYSWQRSLAHILELVEDTGSSRTIGLSVPTASAGNRTLS